MSRTIGIKRSWSAGCNWRNMILILCMAGVFPLQNLQESVKKAKCDFLLLSLGKTDCYENYF